MMKYVVPNGYIALWCFYLLGGSLYSGGGVLAQGSLFIALAFSGYCMLRVNLGMRVPAYFKILNVLLLLFTVYGIYYIFFDGHTHIHPAIGGILPKYLYLKDIYISLLPIYAFYFLTSKGYLTPRVIRWWIPVFFIITIFVYMKTEAYLLQKIHDNGSVWEEVTNNVGYHFVALIPSLVLFSHKKLWQYVGLLIALTYIIMSMKRGAILVGAISLLYFIYHSYKNASRNERRWIIRFVVVLTCACWCIVSRQLSESEFFQRRVEDTQSGYLSNRDYIYEKLLSYYLDETSSPQFLFGSGVNRSLDVVGNFAHNDWLEIAINQGAVGLLIYLIYWLIFFGICIKVRNQGDISLIITLTAIPLFLQTIFSMSYNNIPMYLSLMLGYALAYARVPNREPSVNIVCAR